MARQLLLLISTILMYINCTAQDKWAGMGIETNLFAGKILPHTPRFPKQLPDVVTGVEVNAVFQTYGKKRLAPTQEVSLSGFCVYVHRLWH